MAKSTQQNSRGTVNRKNVTTVGNGSGAESGDVSQGEEVPGPGVRYFTTLNERANKSLNRNAGPERPMANKGMIPNVSQESRKTGKVGG